MNNFIYFTLTEIAMPGEQLMCVWEAVWATDSCKSTAPSTGLVKTITSSLTDNAAARFNSDRFLHRFKDSTVQFAAYKIYVTEVLKEREVPMEMVLDGIEERCWDICKLTYQMPAMSCSEKTMKMLWQIFLSISQAGSYPAAISSINTIWIMEKIISGVQASTRKSKNFALDQNNHVTFKVFLDMVQKVVDSLSGTSAMETCIKDMHAWLVQQICMAGWLYKRTRKHSNWTNWIKRWFILKPGKLEYFDGPLCKYKKGEVSLTSHSKLEKIDGKRSSIIGRNLSHRFRVTNCPYLEIEMCTANDKEKVIWMTTIDEIIETSKLGVTPIQVLLREREAGITGKYKGNLQETEKRLNTLRMTACRRKISEDKMEEKKEKVNIKLPQPPPAKITDARANGQSAGNGTVASGEGKSFLKATESDEEQTDNNMYADQMDRMKLIFGKLDTDGNGYIDKAEFGQFVKQLGLLEMQDQEIDLIFQTVDKKGEGKLTLEDFTDYLIQFVMDERGSMDTNKEANLRQAFLKADNTGTGTVNFKEFTEFAWERKRSVRVSLLMKSFHSMDNGKKGEISYNNFRKFFQQDTELDTIKEEVLTSLRPKYSRQKSHSLENYLKKMYKDTDIDHLASYLRSRWEVFASFRRYGQSGEVVMQGGSGMVADILPGQYNLIDLACFSDLPPLQPRHIAIKKPEWMQSTISGKSGKIIFPSDFSGDIPIDIATDQHLRYYGCSFADSNQVQVSLLYRHGIQDFTYQNKYLEDYVKLKNGGAGIERHDFSHLDCPLGADSGHFILAKFDEESGDLHITAFKVPTRHTLYIPCGCIHSNDYLKGTWRTMLSDEADIDHVHITRRLSNASSSDDVEHITFSFVSMM